MFWPFLMLSYFFTLGQMLFIALQYCTTESKCAIDALETFFKKYCETFRKTAFLAVVARDSVSCLFSTP